jgi:hypothetical protein
VTAAEAASGVKVYGQIVLLYHGFHARNWGDRRQIVWGNPALTVQATQWLHDHGLWMRLWSRVCGLQGRSVLASQPPANLAAKVWATAH